MKNPLSPSWAVAQVPSLCPISLTFLSILISWTQLPGGFSLWNRKATDHSTLFMTIKQLEVFTLSEVCILSIVFPHLTCPQPGACCHHFFIGHTAFLPFLWHYHLWSNLLLSVSLIMQLYHDTCQTQSFNNLPNLVFLPDKTLCFLLIFLP
jgi:hypothetical protein